jgi:hypothetical protein
MHYELLAISTGNRIAKPSGEVEALALVRELLAIGWEADDLGLILAPDNESECDTVGSVPEGSALAERAYAVA